MEKSQPNRLDLDGSFENIVPVMLTDTLINSELGRFKCVYCKNTYKSMLTNTIELIEPLIHEDFMFNLTNDEELNYEPENEDIYANALNSNETYLDDIKNVH